MEPLYISCQSFSILHQYFIISKSNSQNETEALSYKKAFCYELKIKGLLCEIFGMILCEHQNDLAKFVPSNLLELERLEQILTFSDLLFSKKEQPL